MLNENHIARNLRILRMAAGLKQKDVAASLLVSPQTVSKWEMGITLPDVPNLCRLSELLGVSPEAILSEPAERCQAAYLGIDGGGTKTDFALCDEEGNILRTVTREGCNPTVCGMEKTVSILDSGVDALGSSDFEVRGVFAGIAGCADPSRRGAVVAALSHRFAGIPIQADADIVNVIYSTEHRDRCIAAICGTGSVAFAKCDGALYRVGGWGPMFDPAGSGFDIGRDAIRAALAEADGFGPHTLLTEAVREKFGCPIFVGAASILPSESSKVASFAPLVFEAEKKGDEVASEILSRNFSRLAELVVSAAEQYRCGPHVILAGGVVSEEETVRQYLQPHLPSDLCLTVPRVPPIIGALAAAREVGKNKPL